MTNGLHGTEEVQQEGEDEDRNEDGQVRSQRVLNLTRDEEGRQLLCPVCRTNAEEP